MNSELLNSPEKSGRQIISFDRFSFDIERQILLEGEKIVSLTPKTCVLLGVFIENAGHILTKNDLMEMVWKDTFVEESNLTHHIAALRKALGKNANFIETVPRKGYRFVAPLAEEEFEIVITERVEKNLIEIEDVTDERQIESKSKKYFFAAGLILCLLLAGAFFWWRMPAKNTIEAKTTSLALSISGNAGSFSISPDKKMLAFDWNGNKSKNQNIYVQLIGSGEPLQLTNTEDSSFSPTWSSDGKTIAFIRRIGDKTEIHFVPALGGQERKLCDLVGKISMNLTWSPDGKYLAVVDQNTTGDFARSIVLINPENGERRLLTSPPKDSYGDFYPAFSNDSKTLAFRRDINATSAIYKIPVEGGEPSFVFKETVMIHSIAWSKNNDSLLYSAKHGSVAELFSVSAAGGENSQKVLRLGTQTSRVAFTRDGKDLYYQQNLTDRNIWQANLNETQEQIVEKKKVIANPQIDEYAHFSSDESKISFISERSGASEIWIADVDGSNQLQLTNFNGAEVTSSYWSPDNSKLASHVTLGEDQDIYWTNVASGQAQRVTQGGKHFVRNWSNDGKWIYFAKVENDSTQLWKFSLESGELIQITKNGGNIGAETPDGKWIYFAKWKEGGIWKISTDGKNEEKVFDENEFPGIAKDGEFIASQNGFYLLNRAAKPNPTVKFFDFLSGQLKTIMTNEKIPSFMSAISKNGLVWLYTQLDYKVNEIIKLENID